MNSLDSKQFFSSLQTVSTTKWILYALSTNPDEQEALYHSIKHLDPKETLRNPLLKGTLKESLRLYPTAPFLTRFLPEDAIIDGYDISKGVRHTSLFFLSRRNLKFKFSVVSPHYNEKKKKLV